MVAQLKFAQVGCLMVLLLLMISCQSPAPTLPPPSPTAVNTPAGESSAQTIRLANGDWPPYLSETMPNYGIASQIVIEAFALQGITVEYGFFPWPRAFVLAQDGSWDGSLLWYKNEEREKDFYFSEEVLGGDTVLFHLASEPLEWESIDDLEGLRVGATLEYDYGEEFNQAEQAGLFTVERVPADLQNFEKLLAGRIDVFPLAREIGLYMIQQALTPEQVAQITYHPKPLRSDPGYLMLSRQVEGNEEMLKLFNSGLQELKQSGRLEEIIDQTLQPAN